MLHLWLRDETKPQEQRTAIVPHDVKKLLHAGINVTVESSEVKAFSDLEYVQAGARIVRSGSWREAPKDAFIIGLKELPEEKSPLIHRHIYFGHAYKKQKTSDALLSRFQEGRGVLLDLEYLTDDSGRRIAAFGRWAGFAGAALAVDLWIKINTEKKISLPPVRALASQKECIHQLISKKNQLNWPRVLIIGAKGRCGQGAIACLQALGFSDQQLTLWDQDETKVGGPFREILEHEIFINCVLLGEGVAPFLTREMIFSHSNHEKKASRKLQVISDVSCDPHSPNNPLPIYDSCTSFEQPVLALSDELGLIAIDHLPSMLPRESSEDFSSQLLPYLLKIGDQSAPEFGVWRRAVDIYEKHLTQR